MIKMFLDDSLHHTYVYVDQPYTYFCCYVTLGHYQIAKKFWRAEILVDSPVTAKILSSKSITLRYTASDVMFNRQNITIQKHLQASSAKN